MHRYLYKKNAHQSTVPQAVTKPPGPSYLTDSYYYTEDHTSAPGTHDHSSAERTQTDRESEYRGPQVSHR